MNKLIVVISGPSGAGKSTLIKYLLEEFDNIGLTVSHTTRLPRDTEKEEKDYYFVNKGVFEDMIKKDEFIEYVRCFDNYYGTSHISVNNVLNQKDICILDLDYEGAYKLLSNKLFKTRCVGILVLPPSLKILKERLNERKSETPHSLNKRVEESFIVSRIASYHHVIINNDLNISKYQIKQIIKQYIK